MQRPHCVSYLPSVSCSLPSFICWSSGIYSSFTANSLKNSNAGYSRPPPPHSFCCRVQRWIQVQLSIRNFHTVKCNIRPFTSLQIYITTQYCHTQLTHWFESIYWNYLLFAHLHDILYNAIYYSFTHHAYTTQLWFYQSLLIDKKHKYLCTSTIYWKKVQNWP